MMDFYGSLARPSPVTQQILRVGRMKMPLERHLARDRLLQLPRIPMPRVHRVRDQPRRFGVADAAHGANAGVGPHGTAISGAWFFSSYGGILELRRGIQAAS